MSVRDLITGPNGLWSRTQIAILIQTVLALVLIISEVIWGGILTWPILAAQAGLFLFAIIDRMHTRHVELKVGSAHLKISCDPPPVVEE